MTRQEDLHRHRAGRPHHRDPGCQEDGYVLPQPPAQARQHAVAEEDRQETHVEDIGARLVVFSVPALFDADLNIAKEFETSAGQNEPRFCIEDSPGYRQLRLMLKRNDIAYIDLVPDFREAVMKEGRDLFVRGDWHWNGEGHALAAGRVYEALKSRGHLPK